MNNVDKWTTRRLSTIVSRDVKGSDCAEVVWIAGVARCVVAYGIRARASASRSLTCPHTAEGYLDAVADEPDDRSGKILNWAKPTEKIIRMFNTMQYAQ